MDQRCAIVLYGDALSLAAVGSSLGPVQQVDPTAPNVADHLRELHPDVLLFDLRAAQPQAVVALLQELPDLLLIGVDLADHRALVLSGRQPQLFTTGDLVTLIETHLDRDPAVEEKQGGKTPCSGRNLPKETIP